MRNIAGFVVLRALVVLGVLAAAPPRVAAQDAAAVTCKDGSTGKAGKGACSHHGGVDKGAPAPTSAPAPRNDNATPPPAATRREAPAPTRATPPPSSAKTGQKTGQPTAKCKDGSMSFSTHHSGSCSHHGGVGQWLDGTQ